MGFGQQMGSLKNLKQSMAKGGGSFIKYVPKNGSMNVRFIQEPEKWVNYIEHFDPVARKSFPCNGEQNCPGCASGERKSSRYLANAVDRDNQDRVVPLQLPKDLANRLVIRYERNGTLTDRDFELSRAGEGLDTVYDLDAGVVDRAKIDKFKPMDLLKVLEDAYNNVFGGGDEDEDEAPKVTKTRKKSAAAGRIAGKAEPEPDEDEDDEGPGPYGAEDDEPVEEAPAPKKKSAKKAAKKAAAPEPEFDPEVDDEDDEDEPVDDEPDEADPDEDDDEDEGYTEEVLRAMPLGVLRKTARDQFGVNTRGLSVDQIIDAIFDAVDADEDEEAPPF